MPINMQVEYPKLVAENQKIKRLLEELTPGGSEFHNDPEYCAKWIRENRQENHFSLAKIIKAEKEENKRLADSNKELKQLAKECLFIFSNEANYPEGTRGYQIAQKCRQLQ